METKGDTIVIDKILCDQSPSRGTRVHILYKEDEGLAQEGSKAQREMVHSLRGKGGIPNCIAQA